MLIKPHSQFYRSLEVGDMVTRMIGGEVACELKVTEVTDTEIICGPWTFHRDTGAEIDEDLGWDGVNHTGSYLKGPGV